MSCITCDHTMQRVNGGNPPVFWCPRCGTIKTGGGVPEFEAPTLIKRSRDLCIVVDNGAANRGHYLDQVTARYMREVRECFCQTQL